MNQLPVRKCPECKEPRLKASGITGKYYKRCTSCSNKRKRRLRKERGLPASKYSYAYKKKRAKYIADKCCEFCGTKIELTIDHIKPLKDGGELMDTRNWRVLCLFHHRLITDALLHGHRTGEPYLNHIKRRLRAYRYESVWSLKRFLRKNNFWRSRFSGKKFSGV